MSDEPYTAKTYPNKDNIRKYVLMLTEPIKDYMLRVMEKYDKELSKKTFPYYGRPPEKAHIVGAINRITKAKEIHGLADFFHSDNKDEVRAFKYAYCRVKKIKPHYNGTLPSDGDEFQIMIEELHLVRNRAEHYKDSNGNSLDLPDIYANYYGSLMILISKEIGDPSIKTNEKISKLLAQDFKIRDEDAEQVTPGKLKDLQKTIETQELAIDVLKNDNATLRENNDTLRRNNDMMLEMYNSTIKKMEMENENYRKKIEELSDEELNTLRDNAECGDETAQFELACYYQKDETKNLKKSFKWMKDSADNGHCSAQLVMGIGYIRGFDNLDIPVSYETGADYLTRAAEQGNEYAQFTLGLMYIFGQGVERSVDKGIENLKKSAENRCKEALLLVGMMYEKGIAVEKSYSKAFEIYSELSEKGDPTAQFYLGMMYDEGLGVEKSYEKAVEMYTRAAEQELPRAQRYLGEMYYYGIGVDRSYKKAAELYEKAAKNGDYGSDFLLARLYYNGSGVEQSYEKAAELYRIASDHEIVDAQLSLGHMYYFGNGLEQSYEKAAELYEKAADRDNPDAQIYLADMYLVGKGVCQSYAKAAELYEKAADHGKADASFILGGLYFTGNGVEQSFNRAAELFEEAAENGNIKALMTLGDMYARGLGIERSLDKAMDMYSKLSEQGPSPELAEAVKAHTEAAEDGSAEDKYILALWHFIGCGVEKSPDKGFELMLQSAEDGCEYAAEFIRNNVKMTPKSDDQ